MMTVQEARLAWRKAEAHWWDCSEHDRRVAQEWMIEPYYSMETVQAHFVATGLLLHYLRLEAHEREARV
jgi:hypothetical protein